jgi:uncharacterized protein YcbK (DUF882 family)
MAVVHRGARLRYALAPAFVVGLVGVSLRTAEARDVARANASARHVVEPTVPDLRPIEDSLRGRSGKLRARMLGQSSLSFALPLLQRFFGDSGTVGQPGIHPVDDSLFSGTFSFITLRPFADKVGSSLGQYIMGFWPSERGGAKSPAYDNPEGFIEVTLANQDTRVSEHFELRDFLTHDQHEVWPKYLVLREDLIDKLELVIDDLQEHGVRVEHMSVMSGFRTPHYNRHGGETGGRAGLSRHMYGDAADVFVDNDQDGRMDDLNHDHRIDWRDARVVQQAVERVEAAHPDLVGGVGVYRATRSHGPFAHVDVRGWRARWGRAG